MASVFLSYDHDDAKQARPIALQLEKAGHSVWWDLHVRGGAQFSKVIEDALKAADVVVVLWSKNSVESAWVRDEATSGRDSGRLVPVRIDATDPPLGFRQFQTIDMSRSRGRGSSAELRTLLSDIADIAASKSSPASAPPTAAAPVRGRQIPLGRNALLLAGGALLLLLIVAGVYYWRLSEGDAGSTTVSVASADSTPLSQSMAHNVLVNLGSVAGNSTANFRLVDAASSGRSDLGVSVGAVENGGKIQATVALNSSGDRAVLWSRQLAQPADQRAALEQSAAYAAMAALTCAESGSASRQLGASDLRAYLNACIAYRESAEVEPLVTAFRRTTQAAPKFVPGWAHLLLSEVDVLDPSDSSPATAALASTIRRDIVSARNVDADLPEATIAEMALQPPTSFLSQMSLIDGAVAGHPDNAVLLDRRGAQLSSVGRMDEALSDIERASGLRPYDPTIRSSYIVTLASSGGIDKAWAELAKAKQLWPDSSVIASTDIGINIRYGDFEKTWRAAGLPIDGGVIGYFNILRDPSDANINAWLELARTHKMLRPHRLFIFQALGPLRRVDQLYDFLDQWPIDQDLRGMTSMLFRPWMANVRRDPRFMRLAQRTGLLDYWEKSRKWPDFCAEPDMPYDCKKEAAKLK
jgi:hypothetical protein